MKELLAKEEKKMLGEELVAWRIRQNKTQEYVAKALNMSRWTIARLERDCNSVSEQTCYRMWAYLCRELRKEATANGSIDKYAVDESVRLGKMRIDKENAIDPNDWEVQTTNK